MAPFKPRFSLPGLAPLSQALITLLLEKYLLPCFDKGPASRESVCVRSSVEGTEQSLF